MDEWIGWMKGLDGWNDCINYQMKERNDKLTSFADYIGYRSTRKVGGSGLLAQRLHPMLLHLYSSPPRSNSNIYMYCQLLGFRRKRRINCWIEKNRFPSRMYYSYYYSYTTIKGGNRSNEETTGRLIDESFWI